MVQRMALGALETRFTCRCPGSLLRVRAQSSPLHNGADDCALAGLLGGPRRSEMGSKGTAPVRGKHSIKEPSERPSAPSLLLSRARGVQQMVSGPDLSRLLLPHPSWDPTPGRACVQLGAPPCGSHRKVSLFLPTAQPSPG